MLNFQSRIGIGVCFTLLGTVATAANTDVATVRPSKDMLEARNFAKRLPALRDLDALLRQSGDASGRIKTASQIADAFFFLGRYDSSTVWSRRGLELASASGSRLSEVRALNRLGDALGMQGLYDSARGRYADALQIARKAGDRAGEGLSLLGLGDVTILTGSVDSAQKCYREGFRMTRDAGDTADAALAMANLGNSFTGQGRFDSALACQRESLRLFRASGSSPFTCAALGNMGDAYASLRQEDSALTYYHRSLALADSFGYAAAQVAVLNNLGSWYSDHSRFDSAVFYQHRALSLVQASSDLRAEATAWGNLGTSLYQQGMVDSALAALRRALSLYETIGEQEGILTSLNNLSEIEQLRGRPDNALSLTERALAMARTTGRRKVIANLLSNRGANFQALGRYDRAEACYREALELQRAEGNASGEAVTLGNLGSLYHAWGSTDSAAACYRKGLELARRTGDRVGEATHLANLGGIWADHGRYDSALACLKTSLVLRRAIGDAQGVAASLVALGNVFQEAGVQDSAFRYDREALSRFAAIGNVEGQAVCLNNLGTLWQRQGKVDSALECYQRTILLARASKNREAEAHALNNFGVLGDLIGKPKLAIAPLDSSVRIIEGLRATATGVRRRDFLASEIGCYANLATTLLDAGQADSSLAVSELASARQLSEIFGERNDEVVRFRGASDIARLLPDSLLVVKFWSGDTSARFTLRYVLSRRGLVDARVLKDTTILPSIRAFRTSIEAGQNIGEHSSFREAGKRLRQSLFVGLDSLLPGCRRLVVVPDGPYADVPWDALPMPNGRLLIQSTEVREVRSLALLRHRILRRHKPADLPLLALGGAVYQKPGESADPAVFRNIGQELSRHANGIEITPTAWLTGLRRGWSNLPGSAEEAKLVAGVFPGGRLDTGWAASEGEIKKLSAEGRLERFQMIHLAAHGLSHPWDPDFNAVVLSQPHDSLDREDGYLTAREISGLRIGADMVVLSACQTGLGRSFGGEGSQTLADAFLVAGAGNTAVALWDIDDATTRDFMKKAYETAKKNGIGLADAMRRAKLSFLAGERASGDDAYSEERRRQARPYYWASFATYGWFDSCAPVKAAKASYASGQGPLDSLQRHVDSLQGRADSSSALLDAKKRQLQDVYGQLLQKTEIVPEDPQWLMWGKIRKLMTALWITMRARDSLTGGHAGSLLENSSVPPERIAEDIQARLDRYVALVRDKDSTASVYAASASHFAALLASGKGPEAGILMIGTENDVSLPVLKIGDIIVERKGRPMRSVAEFSASKELPGEDLLKVLRMEPGGEGKADLITVRLPKGSPRIAFLEMVTLDK